MPTIYNKRGNQYSLSVVNPVLGSGELCVEIDTNRIKFGNGVSSWNSLPYAILPSGASNGQFLQYNSGSGLWIASSSGNFSTLQVNGTGVSLVGHTHSSSNITDFNEAVDDRIGSGLFVAGTGINLNYNDAANSFTVSVSGLVNNPSNNRLLTSRDSTTTGIDAESNATFDGTTLAVSGAIFASNIQNNTNSYSIFADTQLNTTQNGTAIVRGISNEVKNVITTGITNSGSMIGINTLSLRNYLVSNDAGTLASLYGLNINYGHGIQQAVTPTTNNAYGIVISPFRGSGTITNAYDIYLAPDVYATGTMTNHYGIYQAQNNWNYFAGNVGIGVVQPSGNNKLQVDGTARINSTVLVVGDGATASVACTNYTNNAQGPQLFLRKSRGTEASGTVVNTNDNLGSLNFQGRNTSGVHVSSSRIRGLCEVTPTGEFVAGQLAFGVSTETVEVADKMWLSSNGSLDIDGNTIRLRSSRTISSSTNTGSTGEVCWDSSYLYLCIATNTWRRISLGSSF